mgnify:CR=1 FL=1
MAEAGIGVDIVEISRMKSILEKTPSFARRVFTEEERAYCDASSLTMRAALLRARRCLKLSARVLVKAWVARMFR